MITVGHDMYRKLFPKLFLTLFCVLLVSAGCASQSVQPLDGDVAALLDVENNVIADMTVPAQGDERVEKPVLLQAAARAEAAGTQLRIVVVDHSAELVAAQSVVDSYGGTALSFKVNDQTFGVASADISADQLSRATAKAGVQTSISDTALAFVSVIEQEGLESPSNVKNILWLIAVVVAAVFFMYQLRNYLKERKRRGRSNRDIDLRRESLFDWAGVLRQDLDRVSEPSLAKEVAEIDGVVVGLLEDLEKAVSAEEIDSVESQMSEEAKKLRTLLQTD